jgi:hypothetical protein
MNQFANANHAEEFHESEFTLQVHNKEENMLFKSAH